MTPIPPDFLVRLAAHRAPSPTQPARARRAAVAALLRDGSAGPEVLLMRRVEQPGDPWSGHISLPGGNAEPEDKDLLATALRETLEEVGLVVPPGALLCRLSPLDAVGRRLSFEMDITPFALRAPRDQTPGLGPEASEVFWFPLAPAARGELDHEQPWRQGKLVRRLPAWKHGPHVVWGLTYRMLKELLTAGGVARAD